MVFPPDSLMLVVVSGLIFLAIRFFVLHSNYLVLSWCAPLTVMAMYYSAMAWQLQPLFSDVVLQRATLRPALFVFFLAVGLFLCNGVVNRAINHTVGKVRAWSWGRLMPKP